MSNLNDIPLDVYCVLGRNKMTIKELSELHGGDLVEFDELAGTKLKLYVNGVLFGEGDPVVINENFGLRISQIFENNAKVMF